MTTRWFFEDRGKCITAWDGLQPATAMKNNTEEEQSPRPIDPASFKQEESIPAPKVHRVFSLLDVKDSIFEGKSPSADLGANALVLINGRIYEVFEVEEILSGGGAE